MTAGLVVLAAIAVAARGFGGVATHRPTANRLPPATAEVTQMTLTRTERVGGTLGYGPATAVLARASGQPPTLPSTPTQSPTTNTVTWLPALGTVVKPGEALYKV